MNLTELRQRVFRETRHLKDAAPSIEDVDDAMNLVQRVYLQPIAKLQGTATYTTAGPSGDDSLEEVTVTTIGSDIYELRFVLDETDGKPGFTITILAEDDDYNDGVRRYGSTYYLQRLGTSRTLRFFYHKTLSDLGSGSSDVQTPQIEARWHDLYWLGAAAWLNPANQMLTAVFQDRLAQFRAERERAGRSGKRYQRVVWPWV